MSGKAGVGNESITPRLEVVGWTGTDEAFQALESEVVGYVRSAHDIGIAWDELREDLAQRHAGVLDEVNVHVVERRRGGLHVLVQGRVAPRSSPSLRIRCEIRDWFGSEDRYGEVHRDICDYVSTSWAYGESWREIKEDIRDRYAETFCFVSIEAVDLPCGDIQVDFVAAVRTAEMED